MKAGFIEWHLLSAPQITLLKLNFGVKLGRVFEMNFTRSSGLTRVFGGTLASNALLIAQQVSNIKLPIVVLCQNDDVANDLASDLETVSAALLQKPLRVLHFPGWELSPYISAAPSLRTRLTRIATLGALSSPSPPQLLLTTLAASCQATGPLKVLRQNTIALQPGESLETRESLINRLVDAAYFRVDTVEDSGTFAVRGDILDVFPPGRSLPLRVEFYGDFIEQMREFDPSTQKTVSGSTPLSETVFLFPAREILIQPGNLQLLREKIKSHADEIGISRNVRDPVLESIQNGVYPDHSDFWAPFAFEKPETLWDHLSSESPVFWQDELSCQEEWGKFYSEQKEFSSGAPEAGVIVPSPDLLFPEFKQVEAIIKNRSSLFFDRVCLNEGDSPSLQRVVVQPNSDLARGSRQSLGDLEPVLRQWLKEGFKVAAFATTSSQVERIRYLLEERNLPCQVGVPPAPSILTIHLGSLSSGFRWPEEGLVCITESEILGARHVRRTKRDSGPSGSSAKAWSGLQALSDLSTGEAVVHKDHGIGLYQGLVRLNLSGAPSDFLLLEYANKDKLYLPVYRLNVIQKYVGAGDSVSLARLGTSNFEKAKEKVKDAVKKLAVNLVQLYAERKIRAGIRFSPRDAAYREFEARFPFDETPDQLKAIEETLADLESGKIMDRLVCGDVGYGKTEVAIRAAFKAVSDGKQVAILVPTTLLAHQHEQSFRARLKEYPVLIQSLSRFKTLQEQKRVLGELSAGKIDIVIGTHRLLSRDVRFHDLGLVIIDEEHRFGVEHKERLKALKASTHVLTLTATPIPRTLHMALSGLRDISLMNTPPVDRLPIRTTISRYDENLIRRAIESEVARGGQVFFVHNRVQTIHQITEKLQKLLPKVRVIIGHGQMGDKELEAAMASFYEKTADILVCTSIIESGLDLPSANTIIINRADTFGLAQLYQIRGRVGRGQYRAFAYLLIPEEGAITELAKRRLEVIQRFVELGSGFSIASHDLEIRGGGDLLGPQQSGHIAAVGFDLYTELLEEAIRELEGKPISPEESSREPEIKTPFSAFLSEQYVPDVHQRLSLYRRFSAAQQEVEIDLLEEELQDRFGPAPEEAQNLLWLIRIKRILKKSGIDILTVGSGKISLTPAPENRINPKKMIELVSKSPKQYQITPDSKTVVMMPTTTLRDLYFALESLLNRVTFNE